MNPEAITEALVRHMADETSCSFFDDRLACDTALYYPNGDSAVVYVTDHDGLFEVSDHSEGMALAMQRLRRRSGVLTTVGQRACAASGLAFTNGRVSTVVTQTDLADAVMRVAAASARIAEAVGFELAKPERARATACTPRLPQQAPLSSCGDTHGRRYNQHVSTAPSEVRPMTVDELKAAALQLAPQARADLARELLSSLDELSEAEIEQLWFAEAARRDRELDAGTVQSLPADEVLARAKARRG